MVGGDRYAETEVAEGVWEIRGVHGWGSGVNAAVVVSGQQALVVDNLYKPPDAKRMFRNLQRRGMMPRALINTHWHTDHNIANCLYHCPIWAHRTAPRLLRRHWPSWVGSPRDKRAGGLRMKAPNRLFEARASFDFAGEAVELIHIPGHTPDSIGVHLPERGVFIAGDAVMDLPFVVFGSTLQSVASLRRIQRLRPKLVIQGHGAPCTSSHLSQDVDYLLSIRRAAQAARRAGVRRPEFLKSPLSEFLTPSRVRSLPERYAEFHQGNLLKVWSETA
jgi:cyclase